MRGWPPSRPASAASAATTTWPERSSRGATSTTCATVAERCSAMCSSTTGRTSSRWRSCYGCSRWSWCRWHRAARARAPVHPGRSWRAGPGLRSQEAARGGARLLRRCHGATARAVGDAALRVDRHGPRADAHPHGSTRGSGRVPGRRSRSRVVPGPPGPGCTWPSTGSTTVAISERPCAPPIGPVPSPSGADCSVSVIAESSGTSLDACLGSAVGWRFWRRSQDAGGQSHRPRPQHALGFARMDDARGASAATIEFERVSKHYDAATAEIGYPGGGR